MRVIEQYYGSVRRDPYHDVHALRPMSVTEMRYYGDQMECYIRVEVNNRALHVKQFFPREIPMHAAMRECRRAIMLQVEKEVFDGR